MSANDDTSINYAKHCLWSVRLDLKRVQSYLFAVPRLNVMIGANALLGETLRGHWRRNRFATIDQRVKSLGELAQAYRSLWPDGLAEYATDANIREDPLKDDEWQDDVAAVAKHSGVLTRDGGHFEALFPTQVDAESFANAAVELLVAQLPGLQATTDVACIKTFNSVWQKQEGVAQPTTANRLDSPAPATETVFDFAQAEVCQYSGLSQHRVKSRMAKQPRR